MHVPSTRPCAPSLTICSHRHRHATLYCVCAPLSALCRAPFLQGPLLSKPLCCRVMLPARPPVHPHPQYTLNVRGFYTSFTWVWLGIVVEAGFSIAAVIGQALALHYLSREREIGRRRRRAWVQAPPLPPPTHKHTQARTARNCNCSCSSCSGRWQHPGGPRFAPQGALHFCWVLGAAHARAPSVCPSAATLLDLQRA